MRKGETMSAEQRAKIGAGNRGKVRTEAQRAAISARIKGNSYRYRPVADRIADKSRREPNGCLVWTGGGDGKPDSYGKVSIKRRMYGVHRVMWELVNGPVPRGLELLHSCDNRRCIELKHLRLGTHAENMADARDKGRLNNARAVAAAAVARSANAMMDDFHVRAREACRRHRAKLHERTALAESRTTPHGADAPIS